MKNIGTSIAQRCGPGSGNGFPKIVDKPAAIRTIAGGITMATAYHRGLQRHLVKPLSSFFTPSFPSVKAAVTGPAKDALEAASSPNHLYSEKKYRYRQTKAYQVGQ